MPRTSRKFVIDNKTGSLIECTRLDDKVVLEQIEAQTNQFKRDLFAEDSIPSHHTRTIARWPIQSVAAGVDPEGIPAAQAKLREHGVHTEYAPNGDAIFRDRAHRKKHCEIFGFVDRDGSYGDPS